MEPNISRGSLLAGTGCAAAGSLVGQLLAVAQAQEATQAKQGQSGGICLSMVFEDGIKVKFDADNYVKSHLRLLHEVYGDSVERIETCAAAVREGLITTVALNAGIPMPRAVTTLWIRDVPTFSQKLGANADRINKELSAVSYGNRLVQPNRVVLELGEARSAITTDTEVFCMYFRQYVPLTGKADGPGAKIIREKAARAATAPPFDARLFSEVYVPKLFAAFPTFAVRRIEATVGMEQGGQKPAQFAAYHLFIRDRAAYDATWPNAFAQVKEEATQLQENAVMIFSDMRVKGIA